MGLTNQSKASWEQTLTSPKQEEILPATLALPWGSSLPAYPRDFGYASLHSHVGQFLKFLSLSLSVYIYVCICGCVCEYIYIYVKYQSISLENPNTLTMLILGGYNCYLKLYNTLQVKPLNYLIFYYELPLWVLILSSVKWEWHCGNGYSSTKVHSSLLRRHISHSSQPPSSPGGRVTMFFPMEYEWKDSYATLG